MKRNSMSLKAIINNIAKENKVSAQSVLQTYMLERLLERISTSKYKDNFILKGGMLISAMLGILFNSFSINWFKETKRSNLNSQLASITMYTQNKTPSEVAEELIIRINQKSQEKTEVEKERDRE